VRHYRGRDNSRAAVHCSEHSRQLLELRDPYWLATILALFVSF
jgi:hypothetical protein